VTFAPRNGITSRAGEITLLARQERVLIAWNHAIEKDVAQNQRVEACPYRKTASHFSKDML
jgi:hypothetical protein